MSDLHSGNIFVHEIFSGQMERIRKMIYLLIREKCLVNFVFDYA